MHWGIIVLGNIKVVYKKQDVVAKMDRKNLAFNSKDSKDDNQILHSFFVNRSRIANDEGMRWMLITVGFTDI